MSIKILFLSKYFVITFLFVFLFIPVKMNISIFADQIEAVETILEVKKKLSLLLDSLELEKQVRIRNDQSFEDLENECKKIHDSINAVREILSRADISIQKPVESLQNKPSLKSFLTSLFKPGDVFGWIIFVIGSLTFLSLIILLIGISNTLILSRAKRSASASVKKDKNRTSLLPTLSLSHSLDSTSNSLVDIENKNSNSLRKIINNDITSLQQFNNHSSPFPESDLMSDETEHFDKEPSISEKIVNAADEGLTVLEISRKYHISVNKVSLVLHIQDMNKLKKK